MRHPACGVAQPRIAETSGLAFVETRNLIRSRGISQIGRARRRKLTFLRLCAVLKGFRKVLSPYSYTSPPFSASGTTGAEIFFAPNQRALSRRRLMSRLIHLFQSAIVAALSTASLAQSLSPPETDPQSLHRPMATWNEAEREFVFEHREKIHLRTDHCARQETHPLLKGTPLPTSRSGEGAERTSAKHRRLQTGGHRRVGRRQGAPGARRLGQGAGGAGAPPWRSRRRARRWASRSRTVISPASTTACRATDRTARQCLRWRDGDQLLDDDFERKVERGRHPPRRPTWPLATARVDPGMELNDQLHAELPRAATPGQRTDHSGETNLIGVPLLGVRRRNWRNLCSGKDLAALMEWNAMRRGCSTAAAM